MGHPMSLDFVAWSVKFQRAVVAKNSLMGGRGVPLIDWAAASVYFQNKTPIKQAAAAYWEKHIQ